MPRNASIIDIMTNDKRQIADDDKTADETVVEQRCAPVPSELENQLRVVAKLNNRTCQEEVQIAIEKRVQNFQRAKECQEGMLPESDCKYIDY